MRRLKQVGKLEVPNNYMYCDNVLYGYDKKKVKISKQKTTYIYKKTQIPIVKYTRHNCKYAKLCYILFRRFVLRWLTSTMTISVVLQVFKLNNN